LALATILAGCTPAGPRAFFDGKNYLDQGDYANAAARFKIAATLLATNAAVWNYYGMALQADHQPQAAAAAYQRAVDLDRDLVEAHFNLGGLWLEQNQPDAARSEFTAYTLRRSNDPAGWLKLGSAQLRLGETVAAEKSFSKVLYLKPADPAAYNGLGLTRIQRGMPRDAVRFFAAATRSDPNFAPALLNLATVSHEFLHDDKTALANLRTYLVLTPPPADWDQANALANQLEHAASAPPPLVAAPSMPAESLEPRLPAVAESVRAPRHESENRPRNTQNNNKNEVLAPTPAAAPSLPPLPVQVEQVTAPPEIVASPREAANLSSQPATASQSASQIAANQPAPATSGQKPSLWQRLFASSSAQPSQPESPYLEKGVTPLPHISDGTDGSEPSPPRPAPVPLSQFPRYQFLSPGRPAAGQHFNGTPAAADFTRARIYEQAEKWPDALQYFAAAAQADPSWFLAQYNTALMAQHLRIYSQALAAYEYALAIQPESNDTRYNFALALRAAGYIPDAIDELNKVLAARPDDAAVHLALANIYAQSVHDPSTARRHYLKVLALDPDSPQASNIRFWLAANPE
jgi:tetratricopeptide (TPR) repeat protein